MKITSEQAVKILSEMKSSNMIFGVEFIKKDGSVRKMNCRFNVKSHLKGGELAYDPSEYDLMTVFDMDKKNYRMINLETIQSLSIKGEEFKVS
jgi:hypothetical protein